MNQMRIEPFELERWMTTWETEVEYDLAESGIQPISVNELGRLTGEQERISDLLEQPLLYSEACGTIELRTLIAELYEHTGPENILVTTGAIEANFLLFNTLLVQGDEVIVVDPCYQQLASVPKALGCDVKLWKLIPENDFRYDIDELRQLVSPRTRMIVVNSPHNPSGSILTQDEMDEVYAIAEGVGAWVLSDEAYRWLTLPDQPACAGPARDLGDSGLSVGTLSKPFGLPGLRIGWLAAPADVVAACWSFRDYISLSPGYLNDRLAQIVLSHRDTLMERTRALASGNLAAVERWIREREGLVDWVRPRGGLLGMLNYKMDIPSAELADNLAKDASVMLAPGSAFGHEHHLRIGFGANPEKFREGLNVAGRYIERVASERGVR
jgi:aspartate/methionine/tyrosine aminotransferase